MTNPERALALPPASPAAPARPVSKARSLAASRSRRRHDLMMGNHLALAHGCFAVTSNQRDASVEASLIYTTHPGLDDLADRRMVEQLALASVQHRKALIAIEVSGLTPTLTSYVIRLGQLVERLENHVHEREKERQAAMRRGPIIDLSAYRPHPKEEEEPA